MKGTIRNVAAIGMLAAMSIGSAGCLQTMGASMHDNVIKKFPTYAQTKAVWGAVPEGYGRVVVFFPRLALGGITPGGYGYGWSLIKLDKSAQTHVVDQTFVFVDLPAGKHSVSLGGGVILGPAPLEFDVKPDETMYIHASRLKIVPSQEAEPLLEDLRHGYQKPLPFDKQEKSADSVRSHL
jgi:hypothetical protein